MELEFFSTFPNFSPLDKALNDGIMHSECNMVSLNNNDTTVSNYLSKDDREMLFITAQMEKSIIFFDNMADGSKKEEKWLTKNAFLSCTSAKGM